MHFFLFTLKNNVDSTNVKVKNDLNVGGETTVEKLTVNGSMSATDPTLNGNVTMDDVVVNNSLNVSSISVHDITVAWMTALKEIRAEDEDSVRVRDHLAVNATDGEPNIKFTQLGYSEGEILVHPTNTGDGRVKIRTTNQNQTDYDSSLVITVGCDRTNGRPKYDFNSDIFYQNIPSMSGGTELVLNGSNQLYMNTSTRKHKTNIEEDEISLNSHNVLDLPLKTWKRIGDDSGNGEMGYIVEDAVDCPHVINYDNEGNPFSFSLNNFIIYHNEILKSYRTIIEALVGNSDDDEIIEMWEELKNPGHEFGSNPPINPPIKRRKVNISHHVLKRRPERLIHFYWILMKIY